MSDLTQYLKENKAVVVAVVAVWSLVVIAAIVVGVLVLGGTGLARPPQAPISIPTITLEPASGTPGTTVNLRGEGWAPNTMVLVYLLPPETTALPAYATAGSLTDAEGRMTAQFSIPSDDAWQVVGSATVVAQVVGGGATAQATLALQAAEQTPTVTPVFSETMTPVGTPTPVASPGAPLTPVAPSLPRMTASTDLNVRGGPGTNYPTLALIAAGQTAEVVGRNAEGTWWQIALPGLPGGVGWVAAEYVVAENTQDVPVAQAPPPPQTPTTLPPPPTGVAPTPPAVITDWRGEYFANPGLSGQPAVVRNDPAINFAWGAGSPAPMVPPDQFSVRWTRTIGFPAGTYRFYVRVDDGARLWVDGNLIIDQWHQGVPSLYVADASLGEGAHNLRLEYFEWGGEALAQLSWERLESYPDWRAEYYSNPRLEGNPVLVRNEVDINYNWGQGPPAAEVPADSFSVRWTRQIGFASGVYVFAVRVDDGARLWINDDLVIDSWTEGAARVLQAERALTGGNYRLRLEYFDRSGDALVTLRWERKPTGQDDQGSYKPPHAKPGGPYVVNEGSEIVIDGSQSERGDSGIALYQWDYAYDGRKFEPRASGPVVRAVYPDGPATANIALIVTDERGLGDMATVQATVRNVAPSAHAGGPYSGRAGQPLTLAAVANDPSPIDQASLQYRWDFGDGTSGQGAAVVHAYAQPGTYTARVDVTDKDGGRGSATAVVSIGGANQPPQAVIVGPASARVGDQVTFTAEGSRDPDGRLVNYFWDLGDNTSASGLSVGHVFSNPGTYRVTLTVTDDLGATGQTSLRIVISQPVRQPPVARIGGPGGGTTGQSLRFSGQESYDPDGQVTQYAWDFGDGNKSSGSDVTHAYAAAGTYDVRLTVTDNHGLTGSTRKSVVISQQTVENRPPGAVISGPSTGQVDSALVFDGSRSTDADGRVVAYRWDFGDGTVGAGAAVQKAYSRPGSYSVVLEVEDDRGATGRTSQTVTIEPAPPDNQPPTAVIRGPDTALADDLVTFSGEESTDSDGSIATYAWDLGDGTTASGPRVDTQYSQPGEYTIVLTVTDDRGASAQATRRIIIEISQASENRPPMAMITGPSSGTVGEALQFSAGGSTDPDGSITAYQWSFGDGTAGDGREVQKVYGQPGSFTVVLMVTDDDGAGAQAQALVTIAAPTPGPTLTPTPAGTSTPTTTPVPNQAPVAEIAGPPSGQVGEVLTFGAGGSADPDGTIVAYQWDFGDGTTGAGVDLQKVYGQPGSYVVTLIVMDDDGASAQAQVMVSIEAPTPTPTATLTPTTTPVPNQPPVAQIAGPSSGQVDEVLTFSAGASADPDGTIVAYQWDFGDGTTGAGVDLQKVYGQPGSYVVTLMVVDDDGAGAQGQVMVTIEAPTPTPTTTPVPNQPPVAQIAGPSSGQIGEALAFSAGGSADPDGTIVLYQWDFGDGTTGAGVDLQKVYGQPGSYAVVLTVVDDAGAGAQAQVNVTIEAPPEPTPTPTPTEAPNESPTARIEGPASGQVGEPLTFSGAASVDPDGSVVAYQWDFGDGTGGEGAEVQHVYGQPGEYAVALQVADNGGATAQAVMRVSIEAAAPPNQPPTARIEGPHSGQAGETLVFSAAGSSDPDGSIVAYQWTFGDGTSAEGTQVQKVYDQPGGYTMVLTVTDDQGATAQEDLTVTIEAPPEPNQPPAAQISGPSSGKVGETLTFSSAGSSDQDGSIVAYQWDFGDGAGGEGVDIQHAYSGPGEYAVVLRVTDDEGATAQAEQRIVIEAEAEAPPNQSPLAWISGPVAGQAGVGLRFSGGRSSDSDGSIVQFAWDFGDGGRGEGVETEHVFASPGAYVILLTVTDNAGAQGLAVKWVQIREAAPDNQAPTAAIAGPGQTQRGVLLTLDASGSSDPDGSIVSYDWDFGDGTSWTGAVVQKVFAQEGVFDATLTVTDDAGATGSSTLTVSVGPLAPGNEPPRAAITGTARLSVGRSATLNGGESSDPDGGIVSYAWYFGDGSTAGGTMAEKVFDRPGTYAVVLTVTDDGGLNAQAIRWLTVEP